MHVGCFSWLHRPVFHYVVTEAGFSLGGHAINKSTALVCNRRPTSTSVTLIRVMPEKIRSVGNHAKLVVINRR